MRPRSLKVLNKSIAVRYCSTQANPKYINQAQSGKENFEKDYEKTHVQTTLFQKVLLGIGSGVISLASPSRGDMVAVMGEVTGSKALEYVRGRMLESEEGRKILSEKPRISSVSVDLNLLKSYPEGSLGKAYSNFLEKYGYSPDMRNAVRFVDDIELAYVAQRYREVHDLFHTVLQMPTNMLGEVTVKWVEAIQTKLPMCITGALFGSVRLAPKFSRCYSTIGKMRVDNNIIKNLDVNSIDPNHHSGVLHVECQEIPLVIQKGIALSLEGQNLRFLVKNGQKLNRQLIERQSPPEPYHIEEKRKEICANIMAKYGLNELDDIKDKLRKKIMKTLNKQLKSVTYNWQAINYDKSLAFQYLIMRAPMEYAVVKRVFNEILLRDKEFQPKSLFDFGTGVGTVIWAAHDNWGSSIRQYYCVDSSSKMLDVSQSILNHADLEKEPVIKNVFYRQFMPMSHQPHDIVISSFSFFELNNCEDRLRMLTLLWNNTNKYLILIENGTNAGHSLIEEARQYILSVSKENNVECHVFAPCPHDQDCPRFMAEGKRTPCNFRVAYKNLPVPILRSTTESHLFSYVIFKKEKGPSESERQCRIVRKVLKRHRHVVCHLCTNKGDLNTTFVSAKNIEKFAYQSLKQSHWGDLVPPYVKLVNSGDMEEIVSDQDSDSDSDSDDKSKQITSDEEKNSTDK